MSRALRSVTVLMSASAALFGGAVAIAHQPIARTAGTCNVGSGYGYHYTYLISLTVQGTSCSTGKYVAKHHGHVSGWQCSTKRLITGPVQYDARVKCSSGSRHIKWTFAQNTH